MKYWLPVSGVTLLSSSAALTLSYEYPDYTKALEVYFYDKDNSNKQERIKVWVEDLGSLSRVQYYDTASNSWKKLSRERGEKFKKYAFLSSLASYYIQIQHWINIVRHLEWLGKKDTGHINSRCCNQGSTCNSGDDIKTQKRFSLYLTNLASSRGDIYFSPVQVHIKLSDTDDFEKLLTEDSQDEKNLSGSMVYGFVDYYYKPLDSGLEKDFYKDIKPHEIDHENKRYYYANYPQSFKFKHDKIKLIEGGKTNLLNIHKELKNKKNLLKTYTGSSSGSCDDISCIISQNYIQKQESLDSIQSSIKSSQTCTPSQ